MSAVVDVETKVWEAWDRKAAHLNLRCSEGSELIIYPERDIYFMTGMCSWHAHMHDKDD